MHIRDLSGKRICILGFGREGRAMADALEEYASGANITVMDKNADLPTTHYSLLTGANYLKHLSTFDTVIKSPGVPPGPELAPYESILTTPTQIFLDSIRESGAVIIGVTGSKGKTTTSTLLHDILKAAGKDVHLVGNIGEPAIKHLKDAKKDTIFVQEFSSYQLMDLATSPDIAIITSFFPEHLDYHSTRPPSADSLMASHSTGSTPLENYLEAKKHIARFQSTDGIVFYNKLSKEAKEIANESKGKKIPFGPADAPVTLSEIKLLGEHNLGNIAAAYKAALHMGAKHDIAVSVIKNFQGLPHRLESVGIKGGIEWINDSISTAPETAVAALNALGDRARVILLGGQDRGYDFTPLAERLKTSHVKTVVLLPDSGIIIGKAIEHAGAGVILAQANGLEEAMTTAKQAALDAKEGAKIPIVLLSPAAPSYGHFKNFEDRGNQFRTLVQKM